MINKRPFFTGTISPDLKKKVLLKTGIILLIIDAFLLLLYILLLLIEPNFTSIIAAWVIFYSIILPVIIIMIPTSLYLSAYIRRFSFSIFENEIIIIHGVFTRTRATIPYSRIQNINITNGVFDRVYELYTVKIETAGSSAAASGSQGGAIRPEGYIPGLKEPNVIEQKIREQIIKYSAIPSGLEDKIFKPEELAFDNFISYILSKMREGEFLETRITELREKANLSMAQLAEKVGVPIQTIKFLEEGRYSPSLTLALKIAEVLNCKIEDLFKLT
ncbi:MAG: PH domain-containing protein [Promethearchaeota archaeon]